MTSRCLSLLKIVGPRAITAPTVNNPNSRAVGSLWRVFFQHKEEGEEILRPPFGAVETIHPAASDIVLARQERLAFAREHYRKVMIAPAAHTNASPATRNVHERDAQQVTPPNLDIPHGDEYLHLPQ